MRILFALFVVCLALLGAGAAFAGYTYDATTGYYYDSAGVAYTRSSSEASDYQWVDGYWYTYYGCRYWQSGYWKRVTSTSYSYSPVKVDTANGFNTARDRLLKIKEGQANIENRIRLEAAEMMLLNEHAKNLGVSGNLYSNDLTGNPFGAYLGGNGFGGMNGASLLSGNLAGQQNGNTQYGYSYKSVTDAYGRQDIDAQVAGAQRIAQRSQDATQAAVGGQLGLVQTNAAGARSVAEINAKTQLAAEVLRGIFSDMRVTPQTQNTTTITGSGTATVPVAPVAPQATQPAIFDRATWLKAPGPVSCVACHGQGTASQSKFDLMTYDPEGSLRAKVLECVSGQSKTCKMPKGADTLPATSQLQLITRQIMPAAKE